MLKSTLKPQEPLPVLKEVNEEAKKERSRDKDMKKRGRLSGNESIMPIKKVCRSTNQSPKNDPGSKDNLVRDQNVKA